ncbi:MAG: hypothetical protein KatS3mg031_2649 [Chitinophagales bacterium]|nr:MAG: hypothetical protein KatS3mg031_2649 [Chitinophagales bacterium]
MIKDIEFKKVEGIAVAVAKGSGEQANSWFVYLINMKDKAIQGVLVSSKGYGVHQGKRVETSSLRQFFDRIEGRDFVKLELLPENLTGLSNQFWVSFWQDGFLYDKKYVFVPESIVENNCVNIPILNKRGVMIK